MRTVVAAEPLVPIPIYRMLEATQMFGLESAACEVPTVIVPVPLVAVYVLVEVLAGLRTELTS